MSTLRAGLLLYVLVLGLGALTIALWLSADTRSAALFLNSAKLALSTCAISVPAGTVLSLLLWRTNLPGRQIFSVLLGMLLFIPLFVQVAAWQAGFGLLGWFTVANSGMTWLEGWRGAIWVHSVAAIPWVMLIVGLGLRYVEPELEEEALLEGTPAQVLLRVTLRRSVAAIGAAALWVIVCAAGEMAVTDLFQVRTYAEELYTEVAIGGEPGAAPLRVLPGIALTAWLVFAGLLVCGQLVPPESQVSVRPRHMFQLRGWKWPVFSGVFLTMLLLWGLPLANLAHQAGVQVTRTSGSLERHWSIFKLAEVLMRTPSDFSREFLDTAAVGICAASAIVAVAVPMALAARRGGVFAWPAFFTTAVLMAVPGPVIGISLIWLLNRPDQEWLLMLYDHRFFAPVVALTLRGLPLAILVLWHALRTVPTETLEAAATQGAGPLQRWLRIGLPQRRIAIPVAWLVSLAVAWGDLSASVLVLPPGTHTLAWRIADLVHFGSDDRIAGISLWLMGIFALLGVLVSALVRRWDQ